MIPELNLVPWNCKVIIEPRHPRAQSPLLGSSQMTVLQQIEADCSGSHYEEAGRWLLFWPTWLSEIWGSVEQNKFIRLTTMVPQRRQRTDVVP